MLHNFRYMFIITCVACVCGATNAAPLYGTYTDDDVILGEEHVTQPTQSYSADNPISFDTSDPLYLLSDNAILSESVINYSDDPSVLRLGQGLSYGVTNRFTIGANVHYQFDFDGHEDGFSSIDVGGKYRLAYVGDNNAHIMTDVIAGLKFGGSSHVRTPWFADSTYYAGLRFGRQWRALTLAGTVKSSWIFDKTRGMSYIDFVPEAYLRLSMDWRIGADLTIRKSTNPDYNQEWINMKLVRQYGRTQYIGHAGYEFEDNDFIIGFRLNILF